MRIDLTGQTFGRLRVLGFNYRNKHAQSHWKVKCECGVIKDVTGGSLRNGRTKSCGCLRKETTSKSKRKHGMKGTTIYRAWQAMKERCCNPNNNHYKYYGGRGIKVCERWMSFENFYKDMGIRPKELTLDRKDNDGNYEPDNCKWSTLDEQANNKSNNTILTHNGTSLTVSQWTKELGLKKGVISSRLFLGWPINKILRANQLN